MVIVSFCRVSKSCAVASAVMAVNKKIDYASIGIPLTAKYSEQGD